MRKKFYAQSLVIIVQSDVNTVFIYCYFHCMRSSSSFQHANSLYCESTALLSNSKYYTGSLIILKLLGVHFFQNDLL